MDFPAQKTINSYRNLIVYAKAIENSIDLFAYYKQEKLVWADQFLIRQILRAATSIGANIAEGYGRMHKKDYRRFLGIARGSSFEVEFWASLISTIRPSDKQILDKILRTNEEVSKILTTLMKKLGS